VWSEWRSVADLGALPRRLTGGLDRVDDAVVAGAAAEMTGEAFADAGRVAGQVHVQQVGGADGDTGGAKAALNRALTYEGVGEELPLPVGQSFQGYDLAPLDLLRVREAGKGRLAVQQHCATAAHPLRGATVLDRCHPAAFAEHTQEMLSLLVRDGGGLPVERERYVRHGAYLPLRTAMISAAMLIAISSGVWLPIDTPTGAWTPSRSFASTPSPSMAAYICRTLASDPIRPR